MSKICFLIPDGIGIRNYLYSDLLHLLHQSGHEVVIWHNLPMEVIELSSKINGFFPQQQSFKSFPEDAVVQILRETSTYARLKHNADLTDNPTILHNWPEKKGAFKRKLLLWISELLGKQIKDYKGITGTEKLYFKQLRRIPAYVQYVKDLKEINPDLLFCTHQRFPGAAVAMAAAEDLNVKALSAIFSWDNLPKARLVLRSNTYTVWSEYMRNELKFFYPEIKDEQIAVTGTPQFDFYRNEHLLQTREDFAIQFGLDPIKKWVCFSGSDGTTSPYDALYLRDVANALKDDNDIQLIFRQVPVEGIERYADVLQEFPYIIHLPPLWHKGKYWNEFYPKPEDIKHLVNLSFHCATVVNIGSTMALDFSWFNSPGLYLNYDHSKEQKWKTRNVYNYQHFRSMQGWDAVVFANSPDEIKRHIRQIIDQPESVAKDRKLWLQKIVGDLDGPTASTRLHDLLVKTISY